MASNYLATILALTKPDASAGLFTTVNGLTNSATQIGSGTLAKTATGWHFESTDALDTVASFACSSNSLPINYRSIWTDFGGGNETDSHGWNYNSQGEDPNHWGMAVVLETPFSGLMEYWWNYEAPTASAFATWRSMFSFVVQATSVAEVEWRYDKMKWFANPNRNAEVNPLFEINTFNEIITSNAAFGVGADPRADENGAMFKVAGSAGTAVEHVVIAPTQMTTTGTVVSVQVPNVADVFAYSAQGSVSGTLNNVLRNTHATGAIRDTLWGVGGDVSHRWLTTNGDFVAGVDNSDSGAWKLAASDTLDNLTAMRVDKTTLATTLFGGLTITPGIANTTLLTSTGYSSTGSDSGYGINLQGTFNTSGDPIFLRANVANTASGASALFMSLTVDSLPILTLSPTGVLTSYGGLNLSGAVGISFGSSELANDAANILSLRNGTTSQALKIYGTASGTPGTDYTRLSLGAITDDDATTFSAHIAAETGGTGRDNGNIVLTPAGIGNLKINISGTDKGFVVSGLDNLNKLCAIHSNRYAAFQVQGNINGSGGDAYIGLGTGGSAGVPASSWYVGLASNTLYFGRKTSAGWGAPGDSDLLSLTTTGNFAVLLGQLRLATTATPASASAAGTTGTVNWDADFIYVCTATNTWKRAAIATW